MSNIEIDRYSPEYKQWRLAVLSRDGNECCQCANINVTLEVHHIKMISEYPHFALDKDNGITLCIYCHNKEHPFLPQHRWKKKKDRDSRGRKIYSYTILDISNASGRSIQAIRSDIQRGKLNLSNLRSTLGYIIWAENKDKLKNYWLNPGNGLKNKADDSEKGAK